MKALAIPASAALLIALAGCNQLGAGGGDANNSASNAAAGNASVGKDSGGGNSSAEASGGKDMAAGAIPASSGPVTLDRTYVMGRWADDGEDCANAIEFTQDGRFITGNGNGGGLWNLDGDRLTMTGRATATIRIVPIDQNTMTVVNPDGSLGRSTRC